MARWWPSWARRVRKTTLLNTLSGLDDLTAGEVLIEGRALHAMSDKERTRYRAQRMGFVFQLFNLLPVLNAVENVELPLLVAGVRPSEARLTAEQALEMVGSTGEEHKRPAEMSGGQQQRVSVARALVNEPAIVWADEPTGSLDSETSAEVMELLTRLNRDKRQTFVLVTQIPPWPFIGSDHPHAFGTDRGPWDRSDELRRVIAGRSGGNA